MELYGKVIDLKYDSYNNIYYVFYETAKSLSYLNDDSFLTLKLKIDRFENMDVINNSKLLNICSNGSLLLSSPFLPSFQPPPPPPSSHTPTIIKVSLTPPTTTTTTTAEIGRNISKEKDSNIDKDYNKWCKITNFRCGNNLNVYIYNYNFLFRI